MNLKRRLKLQGAILQFVGILAILIGGVIGLRRLVFLEDLGVMPILAILGIFICVYGKDRRDLGAKSA